MLVMCKYCMQVVESNSPLLHFVVSTTKNTWRSFTGSLMRLLSSSPVAAVKHESYFLFNGSKLAAFARSAANDNTKPHTISTEDRLQLVDSVTSVLVKLSSAGEFVYISNGCKEV